MTEARSPAPIVASGREARAGAARRRRRSGRGGMESKIGAAELAAAGWRSGR